MKVKVIKKSFYNSKLNKIGDVIEINENKLPSWAEAIDENVETNLKVKDDKGNKDKQIEELSKLSPEEIKDKLDDLLNVASDKGVLIDFEDKSDIALIIELTDLLKGKK